MAITLPGKFMICAAGLVGLLSLLGMASGGPPEEASGQVDLATLYNVSNCRDCHKDGTMAREKPAPILADCYEFNKWNEQDKHRNAYGVLLATGRKRWAGYSA